MGEVTELTTERLLLRRWLPADADAFAALNADPRVMEFLPAPLSRSQSDALLSSIQTHFHDHGFGLWAVQISTLVPFIGCVGLSVPRFAAHFTPCVEVAWRLAADYWGHGYATEAARAALTFAFEHARLPEIVSFTVPQNIRSIGVMKRLGMTRNPADDFEHPALPEGHELRRHVLYRIASATPPNSGSQQTPTSRSLGRRS